MENDMGFKVGDKVRTKTDDKFNNMVGEITSIILSVQNSYWVDLGYTRHIFDHTELELENGDLRSSVQVSNKSCPRCGGELFNKVSEYTGEAINKCKCGWCDTGDKLISFSEVQKDETLNNAGPGLFGGGWI